MPRKKIPKSLMSCCYRKIALTIDKYWLEDLELQLTELPRLLYVFGPFQDLTNEMIQQLIKSLVTEKMLRRRHFMCLLQESVTSLDLSYAGAAANNDTVLSTVMARCPQLTSVNLQGLRSISARCLSDFVASNSGLRRLNLCQTNCNDQVLSATGHCCLELLELNIAFTKTTNSGLYSVCQAFTPALGCKRLVYLNIQGTMIGTQGALHGLQNLPALQHLEFDDTCGLVKMDKETRPDFTGIFQLRVITSHGIKIQPVSSETILQACHRCPFVVEAKLYAGLTDSNIFGLKKLTNLRSLSLGNSEGHNLTFSNGVLPVLTEIGGHLTDLTLADINDLQLLSIGRCCPRLRCLTVVISELDDDTPVLTDVPASQQELQNILCTITQFSFAFPMQRTTCHRAMIKTILQNAKSLKSLTLQYMQTLTSEMLVNILSHNPFHCLQKLKLVSCNNVEPENIECLLLGQNDLTLLELHNCEKITQQDFDRYRQFTQKHHLDCQISWS